MSNKETQANCARFHHDLSKGKFSNGMLCYWL
jgi:hypothetical protein